MTASSALEGSELYVGYVPAFQGMPGWERVYRQDRGTTTSSRLRRVIVENPRNRHERVLVDVTEVASEDLASSLLRAARAESNVDSVPGPTTLGSLSFQYPRVKPQLTYFVRANLAIRVFCCGKDAVDVEPFVDRIVSDLNAPPIAAYDQALTFERAHDATGANVLRYSLKWTLGEWGWFKFQAEHGTLQKGRAPETLLLLSPGIASVVHGWAQEPGRETYAGSTFATTP